MTEQTHVFAIGDDVHIRTTEKMLSLGLARRQGRIDGITPEGRAIVMLQTGATYTISAEDLELV